MITELPTITELLESQITDVFRIGLLIAMFFTMLRTRAVSGTWIPLAAGVVFVAVILPLVNPGQRPEPVATQIITGLGANIVLAAVIAGGWMLWQKLRATQR